MGAFGGSTTATPEPVPIFSFGLGCVGIAAIRRRRSRQATS
jgi:hypothetical protein